MRRAPTFAPGDRVVVVFNPHHGDAMGVVGTVVPGERWRGPGGNDLVHVRYRRPLTGEAVARPFGQLNLDVGNPRELLERARRHEEQAKLLRELAAQEAP